MAGRQAEALFAREEQFFGFSPSTFLDGVVNCVTDYTADALDAAENRLKEEKTVKNKEAEKQTEQSLNKVLEIYKKNIDQNFDKFELYVLNNVLRIPEHVVLPKASRSVPAVPTSAQESKLDEDIEVLRKKIAAAKYVNNSLRQQNERLAKEVVDLTPHAEKLRAISQLCAHTKDMPAAMEKIVASAAELAKLLETVKEATEVEPPANAHIHTAASLPDEAHLAEIQKYIT